MHPRKGSISHQGTINQDSISGIFETAYFPRALGPGTCFNWLENIRLNGPGRLNNDRKVMQARRARWAEWEVRHGELIHDMVIWGNKFGGKTAEFLWAGNIWRILTMALDEGYGHADPAGEKWGRKMGNAGL